jgi:hypothetical protein
MVYAMRQSRLFGIFPSGFTVNFGRDKNLNRSIPFNLIINIHLRSNNPKKIPLDKKTIAFGAAGLGLVAAFSPTLIATANGRLPEYILSVKQKTGEVFRTVGCTLASDGNACLQQIIQDRPR